MKLTHPPRHNRPGFTLVELLVVMAIIGILMSLLLAAVFKVLLKTDEVNVRNDLSQLAQAVQAFQTKYSVDYVPSKIILCDNPNDYFVGPPANNQFKPGLYQDSFQYLNRVWPRLQWWSDPQTRQNPLPKQWSYVNPHAPIATLEGHQCLVFFTGGISVKNGNNPGTNGFSTDPYDPTKPINPLDPTTTQRVTFFEFQPSRLVAGGGSTPAGFWAYQDSYGKKPFAYFSHYKTANDYNHASKITGVSDCAALSISPYAETWVSATASNNTYVNPNTFQIISAGKDGAFGPGTTSTGTQYIPGVTNLPSNAAGYDDMSNFYDKLLGISR